MQGELTVRNKNKNNKKMMILSCIGIIMVVLGHTGNQISLIDNIFPYYSFHMALFIFISGYFYKPEYENNIFGKKGYLYKKIKKLVIPYFVWNLIYGIIIMFVKKMNIVGWGENINLISFFINPWINGHQYVLNIASWFLLALFLVNITYIIIRKIFKRIWNDYAAFIVFLVLALSSIYFSKSNTIPYLIPLYRTMFFMFFYHFAYIYKEKIEKKITIPNIIYFAILIAVQLVIFKVDNSVYYVVCFMNFESKLIITPIISSLTGILFWIKISEILIPSIGESKIVNYISNNTFDIMLHHLFCIFCINVVLFKFSTILKLSGFDVTSFKTTIYYTYNAGIPAASIVYTFIGIAVPLAVRLTYEKYIKDKVEKRLQ